MPKTERIVEYLGQSRRVVDLARDYQLNPSTLHRRLDRFGETATGIHRALATGLLNCIQSGQRGARISPWRLQSKSI